MGRDDKNGDVTADRTSEVLYRGGLVEDGSAVSQFGSQQQKPVSRTGSSKLGEPVDCFANDNFRGKERGLAAAHLQALE